MNRLAVFGYASLVNAESAARTLGRPVELQPARLRGWSRAWTLGREQAASEKSFARPDGSVPRYCLGLNVERSETATDPNGVVIELTEAELDRLDVREIRYRRVDVTDAVDAGEFDLVVTYTARPEHHHPTPPADAIVVATYPAAVEAGFEALGPGQLDLYRRTTAPPPVDISPATLVRDAIPSGNPRDW